MKTVDVHPLRPELFLCANNRAECVLFDLRNTRGGSTTTMPRVRTFAGATRSISSAFFSKVTGKTIATVAYDDKIRLYDTSKEEEETDPVESIYHNNQTGQWISPFKAEWHPTREDMFMIGSMRHPRQLDVYSDQGQLIQTLKGDSLGSICSVVKCHPSLDVIAGGNSSGRVHVFM